MKASSRRKNSAATPVGSVTATGMRVAQGHHARARPHQARVGAHLRGAGRRDGGGRRVRPLAQLRQLGAQLGLLDLDRARPLERLACSAAAPTAR